MNLRLSVSWGISDKSFQSLYAVCSCSILSCMLNTVLRDKTFFYKSKSLYALYSCSKLFCVPEVGIEPTLPRELDFESNASTNSATQAYYCKDFFLFLNSSLLWKLIPPLR